MKSKSFARFTLRIFKKTKISRIILKPLICIEKYFFVKFSKKAICSTSFSIFGTYFMTRVFAIIIDWINCRTKSWMFTNSWTWFWMDIIWMFNSQRSLKRAQEYFHKSSWLQSTVSTKTLQRWNDIHIKNQKQSQHLN